MGTRSKDDEFRGTLTLGERAAALRIEEALFGGSSEAVTFDRYEVIEVVGRGAFGSVYRCRDPKLGREVALKIFATADETQIREANTMATLTHPNIATIYDAGVVGEGDAARGYIAMELVVGQSLRQWCSRPRTRAEILAMLAQAGAGLAAAHAAGIVHLDFKPDNVLVGDDGRVRVVDFGLATSQAPEQADNALDDLVEQPNGTMTQTRAGTPAYMAAEQHAGRVGSAQSDQFAFCVTSWEILLGERPFAGKTLAELRANVEAEQPREPTAALELSAPLRDALLVGLSPDPKQRHDSLDELLRYFEPESRDRDWRRISLLSLPLLVIGGIALTFLSGQDAQEELCQPASAQLDAVWNPSIAGATAAAFSSSGRDAADATWQHTRDRLDEYATHWAESRVQACEATNLRKEQSMETLELRMVCFDRHLDELAALIKVFSTADGAVVDRALAATLALPAIEDCGKRSYLRSRPEPKNAATKKAVDEHYSQLATVIALHRTGQGRKALALAQGVAAGAASLEYAPLQAAAAIWIAEAALQVGQVELAMKSSRSAFDFALQSGDDRNAVHATTILAFQGAHDPSKKREALKWVETGTSLLGRIDHDKEYAAKLANAEGNAYLTATEPALARPAFERVVDAFAGIDPNHPNIGSSMAMIGVSYLYEGKLGQAQAKLNEALQRITTSLGANHPEAASVLVNLSLVETALGEYGTAESLLRRGAELQTKVFGESYPLLVYTKLNLGKVLMRRGEYEGAFEQIAVARQLCKRTYGPTHPLLAQILVSESEVLARMSDAASAATAAAQALQLLQATFGAEAIDVAIAHKGLSLVHRFAGNAKAAIDSARQGLALMVRVSPVDPRSMQISFELAESLRVDDQPAEALAIYQRLKASLAGPRIDPRSASLIRFGLAQTLPVANRTQALEEAQQALSLYPRDGDSKERKAISRWLSKHSRGASRSK